MLDECADGGVAIRHWLFRISRIYPENKMVPEANLSGRVRALATRGGDDKVISAARPSGIKKVYGLAFSGTGETAGVDEKTPVAIGTKAARPIKGFGMADMTTRTCLEITRRTADNLSPERDRGTRAWLDIF
jgi:hypothetical protein